MYLCMSVYYKTSENKTSVHSDKIPGIGFPFKLGEPGSILVRTSTQGLKITEKKELPSH